MTSAAVNSVYLDSPVFISVVTRALPEPELTELGELLDQIDRQTLVGVISTFVIAEVRQFSKDGTPADLDEIQAERVRDMFRSGRLVVRPLIEQTAFRAAEIGNQCPALMPADCVHIATAEQFKVDALFTRDGDRSVGRRRPKDMLRYDGQINGLRIVPPFNPMGEMFDALRMMPVGGGQPASQD